MAKKKRTSCIEPAAGGVSCCKVESLISLDDRGQMVLPKEVREKANIRPGDKLALVSWEKNGMPKVQYGEDPVVDRRVPAVEVQTWQKTSAARSDIRRERSKGSQKVRILVSAVAIL